MFRYILVMFLFIATGCATVDAPEGYRIDRETLEETSFGFWIEADQKMRGTVSGELIAVEKDSIYILKNDNLQTVSKRQVEEARLLKHKNQGLGYGLWSAGNAASTMTTGLYSCLGIPLLGTIGIILTSVEVSRGNKVLYPKQGWDTVKKYARFPQGLPGSINPDQLQPKSRTHY